MPALALMCFNMWNTDVEVDIVNIGLKRKRTCHTDIMIRCDKHGVGESKMSVAFKGGLCRQCTTVNCGKCKSVSLADIHGHCIKCHNDRTTKKNAANLAKNGAGTHTVEHACTLEKHADCTLQTVGNTCFRCYKNCNSVAGANKRARESRKELCPCDIKSSDVYDMEGSPCSVCTRPVVQLVAPYDPLGLSLDRTDPSVGYTHANTSAMHYQCNLLKGERTVAETRATLLGIYATFKNGGIVFGAPMNKQAAEWFTADDAPYKRGFRHVFKYVTKQKKAAAKKDDTEFDITWKDTKALFEGQNGQCALCSIACGRDMSFDQIVAGLGYVKDNVQFVHYDCNSGKNRWPTSVLYATAVALHKSLHPDNNTDSV